MRVIAIKRLKDFWEQPKYSDSEQMLKAWYIEAKHANWGTPQDIKDRYRTASFLMDNRVVFNIHGNKYRLIIHVNYRCQTVYIRYIGTHKQYDAIDARTI